MKGQFVWMMTLKNWSLATRRLVNVKQPFLIMNIDTITIFGSAVNTNYALYYSLVKFQRPPQQSGVLFGETAQGLRLQSVYPKKLPT